MENHSGNTQNHWLLFASLVLNLTLIFFAFYSKKGTSKLEAIKQQFAIEKEQWFSKALSQYQYNGKILNKNLLLIAGADSFYLGKLMEAKEEYIVMVSGFKSCTTCLYAELDRFQADTPQEKFMVIAMRGLEDEFYYF